MSRPTIYDVARAAGVSKSLVSLVLRGSEKVSARSRAAVLEAIDELGYLPNRAATDLAAARTMLVGILIDDFANPWFVDLLRGVAHVLEPLGFRLNVMDSVTGVHRDPVESLLAMRVDGIILGRDVPGALMLGSAPPLVVVGTRDGVPDAVDTVRNDDAVGGRLAAQHLISLGHRVIVHLVGVGGAARARRASFERTVLDSGGRTLTAGIPTDSSEAAGYDQALKALSAFPEATAVFAANDVMALGALGAARDLGIEVPKSLSVMGYDDIAMSRTRFASLTTIGDSGFAVGQSAAIRMRKRIEGDLTGPVHEVLPPQLIVRGSTGRRSSIDTHASTL